jgi:hypothetical protein
MELVCTRSPGELGDAKQAYARQFADGPDLKAAVGSDTSGDYRTLLLTKLDQGEYEHDGPNLAPDLCQGAAEQLHKAVGGWGTDEKSLTRIVCGVNPAYWPAIGAAYEAAHQVRKTLSWPRSWANFSLLSLYSHWNAWANLHLLGQPNTFLARRGRCGRISTRRRAATSAARC